MKEIFFINEKNWCRFILYSGGSDFIGIERVGEGGGWGGR